MVKNISKVISTGLKDTAVNREILNSVFGQLSDGIWENSPAMGKYWRYAQVGERGGEIVIEIDSDPRGGFINRDETWIRRFFASKIKETALEEIESRLWDRASSINLSYLGSRQTPVTVSDAYFAYDVLSGRRVDNKIYANDPKLVARQKAIADKKAEISAAQEKLAQLNKELAVL